MSGSRLLITGGGGFLGYYLVQSALHWNDTRAGGGKIDVTVYDNYMRGVPAWLEALRGRPDLQLRRHDMIEPLPTDIGHFDYIIHAAGIASPIYYRAQPLKCIDANINGLRNLLDYAVAERDAGRPLEGFLFYSSSEIYGDPSADGDPDARDLSRQRLLHRPARLLRRVEALRRDAVRDLRASTRAFRCTMARPFNNYGPGLKITDGRVIPDFARDVLAGRDIVMLSDGSPKRTFCYATDAITGYYKVLVRGRRRRALQHRHRPPGDLDGGAGGTRRQGGRASLFGYRGKVVLGKAAARRTTWSTTRIGAARSSTRRARSSASTRRCSIEEGIYRSLIWYSHNQTAEAA